MKFELYLPGDFVVFSGYLRQGKTLNAVRVAWDLAHRLGMPVVSNIPISFSEQLVTTVEEVYSLRNKIFLWDEIQATLDSREFSAAQSIRLTKESIYFGKRGNVLLMTTPNLQMVDVRYRILTHNVYRVRKRYTRRRGWGALVRRFFYDSTLDLLYPMQKWFMGFAPYVGTYDTNYELVVLGSSNEDVKPASIKKAAAPPARGARRPSEAALWEV